MIKKNKHNEFLGSEIVRSDERIDETGEVFTPDWLCKQMVESIPIEDRMNPESKFMDNSAGNGNFIVALIEDLSKYHDRKHVVDNMVYAVELMADNHKELCQRVGVSTDHPHYVNHDALTYDYTFVGRPAGLDRYFV